jgi:hypothetical protein
MELTYTCEKSEKETVELAMRPFRRYFRTMFIIAAVMFVVSVGYTVSDLMVEGLVAQNGVNLGNFCLFMGVFLLFLGWGLRRRFRRGVVDTYRKRKTNLVEYRLSDEGLYCAHGESKATMPWSEFAKYCIDADALYLQCHSGNVACVPDWSGRGVDGADLAAVLEKAGLKRMGASKARRFAYGATWVMLAFVVFGAVFNVHRSWQTLRWHILGIELKRQLHELVCGDGSKGDNPYSYSRYWKERANSVQRLAVLRCRFAFQTRHYIFDVDDECDKVGLAATEGDSVWCIYLPSGCMYQRDLGQLEAIKDCGAFGKFYPESERDKWLEQVRPLAKELHEDMDDDE